MTTKVIVIALPDDADLHKEHLLVKALINPENKVYWATDEDAVTVMSVFDTGE